jgi:hypothetical protein
MAKRRNAATVAIRGKPSTSGKNACGKRIGKSFLRLMKS